MIISLFAFFKHCLKKKKKAKFEEQTWAFFEINEHFVFIFPRIFFFPILAHNFQMLSICAALGVIT